MSTPKIIPVSRETPQTDPESQIHSGGAGDSSQISPAGKDRPEHLRAVAEGDAPMDADGSESLGGLFRRSREKFGLSLGDVEADLCIRKAYLEAIETESFDQLPGTTYAVGFVRAYAELVDLDADEMVRRFKAESLAVPPPIVEPKRKKVGSALPPIERVTTIAKPPPPPPKPKAPVRIAPAASRQVRGTRGGFPIGRAIAAGFLIGVVGVVGVVVYAIFAGGQGGVESASSEVPSATASTSNGVEPNAESNSLEVKVDFRDPSAAQSGTDEIARVINPPIASGNLWPQRSSATGTSVSIGLGTGGDGGTGEALFKPRPKILPYEVSGPAPVVTVDPSQATGSVSADGNATAPPPQPVQPAQLEPAQPAPPVAAASAEPAPNANQVAALPVEPPPVEPTTPANTYGAPSSDSRVTFTAKEKTQIRIHSTTGEVLFDGILYPGDTYRVPNRTGLLLGTDSAGSLKISVDNVSVPSIGPRGATRDNVFLNPMLLREGRAAPR
ncbi:MAG: helix-turn-helix domain-containing protein [Alphaproteobacteria bacterium]|nr:helix-turn-helix domain-containing protein [Alphaproteobacteria bacterium]